MSQLSPEGRAFVRATRALDEPTDIDQARIRRKTLAAIAAAGATAAIPAKAALAGVPAAAAPSIWGGAVIGALLGVVVVGAGAAVEAVSSRTSVRPTATAVQPSPAPPPARSAAPARLAPSSNPSADPEPTKAAEPRARAPSPAAPPSDAASVATPEPSASPDAGAPPPARSIDEEIAVLRDAQEALRAGKPDEAVRLLDGFGATHAGGALAEERQAARIIAACAGGGVEARAEAARFSPWPPRVAAPRPHRRRMRGKTLVLPARSPAPSDTSAVWNASSGQVDVAGLEKTLTAF